VRDLNGDGGHSQSPNSARSDAGSRLSCETRPFADLAWLGTGSPPVSASCPPMVRDMRMSRSLHTCQGPVFLVGGGCAQAGRQLCPGGTWRDARSRGDAFEVHPGSASLNGAPQGWRPRALRPGGGLRPLPEVAPGRVHRPGRPDRRSLAEPAGPWSGFARQTVEDWLALLATAQPPGRVGGPGTPAEHTLALAVLRGALLDLLATGNADRVTTAIHLYLRLTSVNGTTSDAAPATLPGPTRESGTA